ncbi:MAG: tyrosine--tRNA ligase [Euryarchaeota archaeon]|nr:tyrosine--tRNA ligase [Euryarchaeota archaeon]
MDLERRLELVSRPPVVEVVTPGDLRQLLETEARPRHYIGFEISGLLHLGSGLLTAMKLRDFEEAGIQTSIFLADYHTWINRKLGGDLEAIRRVGRQYYTAGFRALGIEKTRFVYASELYQDLDYWTRVVAVARETTLPRAQRTLTIMGRTREEANTVADMLYTPMQVADLFHMDVQIAHAGMDQRKAHMLARELAPALGRQKPVAVHHGLLPGLTSPRRAGLDEDENMDLQVSGKMSKSRPSNCIFLHDSPAEIQRKLQAAYCPPKETRDNPVLRICELLLFPQGPLAVEREAKHGGSLQIGTYPELEGLYREGKLHPADLKRAAGDALAKMLESPRRYFEAHPEILQILNT